jgi:AAA domain, putative AbiEii toxin, Type IV TA system
MTISLCIAQITFSGGQTLQLPPGSTTIIVGPNNSGKTATLRGLLAAVEGKEPGPVVQSATINKSGSSTDLQEWLDANVASISSERGSTREYSWLGVTCDSKTCLAEWGHLGSERLANSWERDKTARLADFFCSLLSVDQRLDHLHAKRIPDSKLVHEFNVVSDAPNSPIHVLLKHEEIEGRLSATFEKAFGKAVILNRGAGTVLLLHCGERPQREHGEDRVSRAFVERVSRLPLLEDQGHGMRSFAGCVIATLASPSMIHLIDEPEAFLHPPQARLLGKLLVADKPDWRQLFVATHSGDLLRGMLEGNGDSLNIVRLTRNGETNQARHLKAADIRKLWADPLLRFSNVLDGLFHETVIICESDSDCRFYAAVADAIHGGDSLRPDALYSSSGGKDRLPVVIASLVGLGVPTRVIADFDVLRSGDLLRKIVVALGGAWDAIKGDWSVVKAAIEQVAPPRLKNQVRDEITNILDAIPGERLLPTDAEGIRMALRATSPWHIAKQTGTGCVPSGKSRAALDSLLKALRSVGLFVVECGELERFVPSIGRHGPRWVAEVLKRDLSYDPELADARRFVADVLRVSISAFPGAPHAKSQEVKTQFESKRMSHVKRILYHLKCLLSLKSS